MFITAPALLGLAFQPGSITLTVALFTLAGVHLAFLPVFWAIPTEILSASAAAAAVGMINAIGSIAGFAGPYAFGYLKTRTGSFSYGLAVIMVTALAAGMVILRTAGAALTTREEGHRE